VIAQAFIIAAFIQCIWYVMQQGEIFGALGNWFNKTLPDQLHNPVFACPVCMTPWYGSILYWLIWHESVKMWAIVVSTAMGIQIIIGKLSHPDK
jgi:hypothetical protein